MSECKMCGKNESELLGPYCGRCNKLVGDMIIDAALELGPRELVV